MFQTKMILLHRYAIHINDLIVNLNMELLIILNLSVATLDACPTAILFIVMLFYCSINLFQIDSQPCNCANFLCLYSSSIVKFASSLIKMKNFSFALG